jgi:hypothetical protein
MTRVPRYQRRPLPAGPRRASRVVRTTASGHTAIERKASAAVTECAAEFPRAD